MMYLISSKARVFSVPIIWVAIVVGVYAVYRLLRVGRRHPRMPPGPPTIPILGNAHQIPLTGLYEKFGEWARVYGSIYSLKIGPTNIIVLSDRKAIHRLLVERGQKYSHRQDGAVSRLVTKGENITLGQYNTAWREKRKVISHVISPKQLDEKHFTIQENEAVVLMNDLLNDPEKFFDHIRRYTASVITAIVFGERAKRYNDFFSHEIYDSLEHVRKLQESSTKILTNKVKYLALMEPGATPPVDDFKFLQFLPEFAAPWKKRAREVGHIIDGVWVEARRKLDARRATGERRSCVADDLLDEYEKKGSPFSDYAFNMLLAEFASAGADTTASQILTLVLAFAKYPEVQEKARKELDAVCGVDRAPLWSDFKELPYVNAIVKEGMRWRPAAPAAVPHFVKEDDEYEGMFIPKNSLIFLATWAIHHNEDEFQDHEAFNPDRYLGFNKLASEYAGSSDWAGRDHYGYGAGRRICPGMHLAERSMWRIASKLLWAFEFSEPLDSSGKVEDLDPRAYVNGLLIAPLRFRLRIKPRSEAHVMKIKGELKAAEEFLSRYS